MTDTDRPAPIDSLRARMRASTARNLPPRPHDRAALPSQEDARPRRPRTLGCCPAPEPSTEPGSDGSAVGYVPLAVTHDEPDDEPEREPMPDSAALLREKRQRSAVPCPAPGPHVPGSTQHCPPASPCLGGCGRVLPLTGFATYAIDGRLPWCATCFAAETGTIPNVGNVAPDEPDDGAPFRPQWAPQLVTDVVKATLRRELAGIVHDPAPPPGDPRATAEWATFRRGYEAGFARALLSLGIHEAASPERASLPAPGATDRPADPAPVVHASAGWWGMVLCGGAVTRDQGTDVTGQPVTCPACLAILRGGAE